MAWNLRDAIIFIIKTLQNIFNVKKTVSGGSTEEQGQPVSSSQPPINAPAPANGSTTPAPTKPFKLSYYVNDEFTDVDKMDLGAIKKAGVGKIYARTSNTGEYGLSLKEFQDFKLRCTKAGLECDGWVFPGYNFAKDLTNAKAGTHIDYETYGIKQFISQIKDYRALTKGGYYSIVSKPDIWDGQQYPNLVMPNVDGYFPMCYLGDFGKTEAQFDSYLKSQVALYGDKFGVAIQAYFSDQNQVPKGKPQLLREIAIAKKYCREAIIFEYGLDNLMATAGSPGATDNSTQPQINPSTAVNLDKFQKLFGVRPKTPQELMNWNRDNIVWILYYNDKITNSEIETQIKNNGVAKANCTDQAQFNRPLLLEMGYDCEFCNGNVKCSDGEWYGHVWLRIRKKGTSTWYYWDACAVTTPGIERPMGQLCCTGGVQNVSYNDAWLLARDKAL